MSYDKKMGFIRHAAAFPFRVYVQHRCVRIKINSYFSG